MEVTSTELNVFVWTEYFPQDMLDCFELVYDIKLNRDEYSSNEEMYAKLSAGGTAYDLAQPTDYIVPLMIRQGLLQELDHSKLPNMKNMDEGWMNQEFDPGNKYSVPYLAGTDAIVVNTDAVENVPDSWADLWDPEYAGRMVFLDDSRAVIGLTLLTLVYDPNTTDPAQLEEAKNKLAELVPNIKLFRQRQPQDRPHRRGCRPGHDLDLRGPGAQGSATAIGPILRARRAALRRAGTRAARGQPG